MFVTVKVAMTESTSSLPSPGYSSLASAAKPTDPQSLMKPPKEFVDLPSKYLYPQKRSQSEGCHIILIAKKSTICL